MAYRFLILGSEKRQFFLQSMLKQKGHQVIQAENYRKGTYDAVLLPIPQTNLYLEACIKQLEEETLVFGCNFSNQLIQECKQKNIHVIDYMKAEGVAQLNSIATAEGSIAEALQYGQKSIHGSHCVVMGYGCCGETLAERLLGLHGKVTIIERKEQKRARAQAYGFDTLDFDKAERALTQADFIFNTVPALVLDEKQLSTVSKEVTIIDIASKPGGVDFAYCEKHQILAKLCLGLPGKYAPKSAAEILLKVIEKQMSKGA